MTDQQRWELVANILNQLSQEVQRIRNNSTLSNAQGIRVMTVALMDDVQRTEPVKPQEIKL